MNLPFKRPGALEAHDDAQPALAFGSKDVVNFTYHHNLSLARRRFAVQNLNGHSPAVLPACHLTFNRAPLHALPVDAIRGEFDSSHRDAAGFHILKIASVKAVVVRSNHEGAPV